MLSHRPQLAQEFALLAEEVFKLERSGKYAEAIADLSQLWPDKARLPKIDHLNDAEAAELLLRCGAVYGFYGHNKQIEGAQDVSRNLVLIARERFFDQHVEHKQAECENYLALAYWRSGEPNEARAWLEESLGRGLDASQPTRLYSSIIRCLILLTEKRYEDIVEELEPLETAFLDRGDDCLKGDFYNNCGLAYKNLGNPAEALVNFRLARHYHLRSGHRVYLGTVENNLAQLYKEERQFQRAHDAIDNAIKIFEEIGDKTRNGFALDTKASIYLAAKDATLAMATAEQAVAIMRTSVNAAYLIDTLMTKSKIHLESDDFAGAVMCLVEAADIAKVQCGEDAMKRLIADFEQAVNDRSVRAAPAAPLPGKQRLADGDLQLVLPKSISAYSRYHGVWIQNSHLESVGLAQGSLAVIAEADVSRGDLAAVIETETDSVTCGFYDTEFGVVCLETPDSEPELFDSAAVKVLGKIVGVCDPLKDAEGKMHVRPLPLV